MPRKKKPSAEAAVRDIRRKTRRRFSAEEKIRIVLEGLRGDLPVRTTLGRLGIPRSTFYGWYERYLAGGFDALKDRKPRVRPGWNQIPERVREQILKLALDRTELSPRELACRFTDDERKNPTRRVHELWQTDFTYFRIIGWGWYYLSTVLDDFSRYIISWKLSATMGATDVQDTLDQALARPCRACRCVTGRGCFQTTAPPTSRRTCANTCMTAA